MKNEFNLRNVLIEDIDSVMEIEHRCFIPEIQEDEKVWLSRMNCFPEGFVIFEDDEKNIIGNFCTERWEQVPSSPADYKVGHDILNCHKKDGKVLYISSFAIFPEYRGEGNGKKLFGKALEFVLNRCEEISGFKMESVVLMVNECWNGAHHIYSSYGFTELFKLKGIFPAGNNNFTDGIVMKKDVC